MLKIQRKILPTALAVVLSTVLNFPSVAFANHNTVTYSYIIGAPGQPANIAMDRRGDTIEFMGEGTLTVHPKTVTGGGRFIHSDSAGDVVATGDWQAMKLRSFRSYGSATPEQISEFGLPAGSGGGRANIKVHLQPDAGGPGVTGTLKVYCLLGDDIPATAEEGIRFNPNGVLNFRHQEHGATLFILQ